ncbi:MAG: DUF4397 domain-containing protein [Woeseiaceae bacterium]
MRKTLLLLSCTAMFALAACTGESSRPTASGTAGFRAINAMPTSPTVTMLIEERLVANVDFKNATGSSTYDDLDYIFNFELRLAGDLTRTRVASVPVETVRDMQYTFVLTGPIASPNITVWEESQREWLETDTVFQARFAHVAASQGPVDVYFLAPGIAPAIGLEAGTLAFDELLAAVDYPAGDYIIYFTTAGDPNDILFTSSTVTPLVRAGFTIFIFDTDANDVGPLSVRSIDDNGSESRVVDVGIMPTVRFFHASSDLIASDVYIDEMLTDQILNNHTFLDVTGDLPVAAGSFPITYTEAGNIGNILYEDTTNFFDGVHNQYYVVGEMDAYISLLLVPDRRSVETLVKFSFLHTATNHDLVDLYIVEPGTDIAEALPRFFNLSVGISPVLVDLLEGDLELYLTPSGETTVLAGPIAISPVYGDVLDYISYNNVDPAIADLVAIPLP